MDKLRVPFFIVALVAVVLVVGIEVGANLLPLPKVTEDDIRQSLKERSSKKDDPMPDIHALWEARQNYPPKPGLAIPYLALIDGLLLWTIGLVASALILPQRILGRIQGIATFIFSLLLIIAGIMLVIAAFTLLMVMLGLFLSPPFGTIAYLAIWGFFNRGGASASLGLIFFLKLVFIVFLLLAQQRFIQ